MYPPPPQPPQKKTKPVLIGCGALFVLLVACGAVVGQSSGSKSAAPSATVTAAATTKAKAKRAAVKPHKAKCPPDRGDVIFRSKVPGVPMSAQVLGSRAYLTDGCETIEDFLAKTTPTGKGYCAAAARVKDNPGYNTEQTPARRLKKPFWVSGVGCA